jgi:hypothetical protein
MTIKVDVPENILTVLEQCGYTQPECENIFKTFLVELMSDMYGQFEIDFDIWLNEKEEEELVEIINGRKI